MSGISSKFFCDMMQHKSDHDDGQYTQILCDYFEHFSSNIFCLKIDELLSYSHIESSKTDCLFVWADLFVILEVRMQV